MEVIALTDENTVYNVYTETSFSIGTSLNIFNNSNNEIFISRQLLEPPAGFGYPLKAGDSIVVPANNTDNIWISGSKGKIVVQRSIDSIADNIVDFPSDVWTSKNPFTRRLQVDPQQTGFEEGREVYCLAEASVLATTEKHYEFIFNTDVIIQSTFLSVFSGDLRLEVWAGGTDNGNFVTPIPIFPANGCSDAQAYTIQTEKYEGGVYNKDGTLINYLRIKTDSNLNRSTLEGGNAIEFLGLPAGSYYFVFINLGVSTAEFIIKERWEERPSQFT